MFAYFILADLNMPLSPEARLTNLVTQISPEVSGKVVGIHVRNNQRVSRGQVLFSIDPRTFSQSVEEARLQLEASDQDNRNIDASVAAARAQLAAARRQAVEAEGQVKRYRALAENKYVSMQSVDTLESTRDVALAQVQSARQTLQGLIVQRGETNANNLRARQALNTLETAQLDLARTQVRAGADGIVSNMQLEHGAYATAGVPRLALVTNTRLLYADFREKSLRHTTQGTRAAVVFDALPGEVFEAEVINVDAGILRGQQDPDGQLASTEQTDRWVRKAERARVNLRLVAPPKADLMSGARATVQLYPHQAGLYSLLADAQIRLISWFHYVY
ncbi:hypothetical protein XB05_19290 [Xanthomonas arboricola]|nr:hypothetical protein XB05_19290 [Xanthomonas arboricola]